MLVIACPHALGLAVPLVIAISTTLGARSGLLVRDRRGLEEARNLNAVVFDKTGTLTAGRAPRGGDATTDRASPEQRRSGSPPRSSGTPSTPSPGRIVTSAQERGHRHSPRRRTSRPCPATACEAMVEGRQLAGGWPEPAAAARTSRCPARCDEFTRQRRRPTGRRRSTWSKGRARSLAAFAVADAVRPESREAVQRLHALGIEVVMLTGDAQPVAEAVARRAGHRHRVRPGAAGGQGGEDPGASARRASASPWWATA